MRVRGPGRQKESRILNGIEIGKRKKTVNLVTFEKKKAKRR